MRQNNSKHSSVDEMGLRLQMANYWKEKTQKEYIWNSTAFHNKLEVFLFLGLKIHVKLTMCF